MPRHLLVVLLILGALSLARAQVPSVRVLLERLDGSVSFRLAEAHRGYSGGRLLFETPFGLDWPMSARAGRLQIDGTTIGRSLTLQSLSGLLEWEGNTYRGSLRFIADGNQILVVNLLDIESYLRGVIPAEMMAVWPEEALKAQAVAARTYTIHSLDPTLPYDICATQECQVYEGVAAEDARTDRAVAETAGLVLTFEGELARTYYHSDSGGVVASSAEVWGTNVPYLVGRSDVNSRTPHRSWRRSLDPQRLRELLHGFGYDIGTIRALRITAYSESGRAQRARLLGSAGEVVLAGSRLTTLLRDAGLKSTRITMVGDLVAEGDGWGHGVGMSQYGARQLALSGYRFDQILTFYYPRTLLQQLAANVGGSSY